MRAITRVPEPPVAPITNGAEWTTPTLATAKAAEQYPALRQFPNLNEKQARDRLSGLGRKAHSTDRRLHSRKPAARLSAPSDDGRDDKDRQFAEKCPSGPARFKTFGQSAQDW